MSSFFENIESATKRTKKYISTIKDQKDLKSKAILLVGSVGTEKSSIVKIITRVTGLSGDGIDSGML
jgi:predicted AAA+ superfamily ATPase